MSGGRRKGLHVLGMAAVLRHWKNACLCGLLDIHQKDALGVLLLGPVRWQYYAASADKKALKKGLIRFDVTMKLQVRGIK